MQQRHWHEAHNRRDAALGSVALGCASVRWPSFVLGSMALVCARFGGPRLCSVRWPSALASRRHGKYWHAMRSERLALVKKQAYLMPAAIELSVVSQNCATSSSEGKCTWSSILASLPAAAQPNVSKVGPCKAQLQLATSIEPCRLLTYPW